MLRIATVLGTSLQNCLLVLFLQAFLNSRLHSPQMFFLNTVLLKQAKRLLTVIPTSIYIQDLLTQNFSV